MIKIADEVREDRVVSVLVRKDLYAHKCHGCGKLFGMKPFANDEQLAVLRGTFAEGVNDPDTGRGLGNMFRAEVCSFQCAHEVFANGGWRSIQEYKPYADADIPLVRGELRITSLLQSEEALKKEWESRVEGSGAVFVSMS